MKPYLLFRVVRSENGQKGRQKKARNERTRKTGTAFFFVAHVFLLTCVFRQVTS